MENKVIGKYIRHFYDSADHVMVVYVVVADILNDQIYSVACYMRGFYADIANYNEETYVDQTRWYGDKISKQEAVALFPGIEPYEYRY